MMSEQHQQNLLKLLADKEQMPGGGFMSDPEAQGVVFAYWPPVGRHEAAIRELVTWCAVALPTLHPSIRVDTAFADTCMTVHCEFEGIDYDRMDLKADLATDIKARIRTEAVIDEARAQLISLVEKMQPGMKAENSETNLGM